MPHFPVLLYHLVPTSLRPRPHPPRRKRLRIHQPTTSTRLCSPTHTPEVSVPKGVATPCGDGTSPATADPTHKPNPAPPPVLAPRASRLAPRTRTRERVPRTAAAGHGHERRVDTASTTCVRVPPRLPVFLSSFSAVCAMSRPTPPSPAPYMPPALSPPS